MKRLLFVATVVVVLLLAATSLGCGGSGEASVSTSPSAGLTSTTATAQPVLDKAKFQDAWRAYKTIDSALTVGVTYPEFGRMVQGYLTELSLVPVSSLTPEEEVVLTTMGEIAQAYIDSYALWERQLDQERLESTLIDGLWTYFITVKNNDYVFMPEAERMSDTYGLPLTTKAKTVGSNEHVLMLMPADSYKDVWVWARQRGEALAAEIGL